MASEAMIERLVEQVEQRYNELTEQLADPDTISNRDKYTALARSHCWEMGSLTSSWSASGSECSGLFNPRRASSASI